MCVCVLFFCRVWHFVGLGTTLGCAQGCAIGLRQWGPKKAFCLPAAPHTVTLYYYCTTTRQLTDLFLFIYWFFVVLGFRVRYCISCHTPFFSHTINISNDQALILAFIGRTTTKSYKGSKHNVLMKHSDTHTHNRALSDIHTHKCLIRSRAYAHTRTWSRARTVTYPHS